jgi:DNA invertase Pin-like site-specific DNA recombinase
MVTRKGCFRAMTGDFPREKLVGVARTSTSKQEKGLDSQMVALDFALEGGLYQDYDLVPLPALPVSHGSRNGTFWEGYPDVTDSDLEAMRLHGGKYWAVEDVSGSVFHKHPVYLAMLDFCRQNNITNVLFEHSDRHSRDTEAILGEIRMRKAEGIFFHYLNFGGMDLSTPAGRMMLTMGAAFAEYYRNDLKAKTTRGMNALKEKGIYAGKPPYGLRVITQKEDKENYGKLLYNPAEMRFILALYDRILQRPGISYRQLAKWANEEGWITRRGKSWTAMGVRRIMTFMLPWKENGEDDTNCGKYFLAEMREDPDLDGM